MALDASHSLAERELAKLWLASRSEADALGKVRLSGADPALPSTFAVGTIAQAAIAAAGLAAAELHHARGGQRQFVAVDIRHAAAEFRSERYVRYEAATPALWDPIAGLYPTRDGRWVRIHTNFAHHRDGVLALLGCENTRAAVQAVLLGWDAETFESEAAAHHLVATMTRTQAEWAAHEQGQAVTALPLLEIDKIGDAPPRARRLGERPLSGIRALDLTRIIAGPVAARTLAAHGAEVLNITSPNLPAIPLLVVDTGRGKRTAHVDLDSAGGVATLKNLARGADVFLQGYRPGGLAMRGFSETDLIALSPGVVVASLSAYGHAGPWSARRGFDSLTQNANGLNWEEALAAAPGEPVQRPKELPAQALDHAAGYLLAFGAMTALRRQMTEGGSWRVRTSLAQVGHWLQSLPRVPGGPAAPDPSRESIVDLLEATPSGFGVLTAVQHAAHLSATPARWDLPAMPLESHAAVWPA
jgi:crotonobetainyl-CoA:carnitine CoA-transferase CaiB-like acyl-CoA transferase